MRLVSGRALQFAMAVLPAVLAVPHACAQSSSRVLVVYNAKVPDSLAVASHYMAARGIPAANLCPISPLDTYTINYSSEYLVSERPAIQACLNAAGRQNILYIVMSYMTPYRVIVESLNYLFALDSFVADIWNPTTTIFSPGPPAVHGYYADSQPLANVYKPFVSLAAWRALPASPSIYSVWRMDATTPALAMGLVDKAMAAETGGLAGIGCFDLLRSVNADGADGDLHRAAEFVRSAGFNVIEDVNESEFGTPPSGRCDGAILYSGWYSFAHYNDAFTWNTGAIGFHIDSSSAGDVRLNPNGDPPVTWSPNAIIRGITVTSGSVNEPFVEGLPRPGGVFHNLLQGASAGDAFLRNIRWLRWMNLHFGDPLYTPFKTKTFLTVWRPADGNWWALQPGTGAPAVQWGILGDIPVAGDFDHDGKLDTAVWRPSTGTWWIVPSRNPAAPFTQTWGLPGDIPVPGDFDGDGQTDFAIWRPSTGAWWVIPSSNPGKLIIQPWGQPGDIPVIGDFDGDGQTDFAVWRPSTGTWSILSSANPAAKVTQQFGLNGDIPVAGDFDGDGQTDIAVWRPSTGTWYVIPSSNPAAPFSQQWGLPGDIPVPFDYDGDKRTDFAVWRPLSGTWYIRPSSAAGTFTQTQWGLPGDVPLYRPPGY